jgi:3-hydroxyisobutyrate dehydrogenase-like beta-hydroxyacid dehydrogenase
MEINDEQWGFVGLGLLGSAFSRRLNEQGVKLFGFDIREHSELEVPVQGLHLTSTLVELVETCDVISFCLPHGEAVREVVAVAGSAWRSGMTVIDHSTLSPNDSLGLAAQLAQRGVDYVEANVAGSSELAEQGKALLFCSGSPSAFQRVKPSLKRLASQVFYLGQTGSASRMKLVFNHLLGLNRAALAESLSFAESQGMPLSVVLEVLRAASPLLDVVRSKGQKMVAQDYRPQAKLAQHLKDVRLILQEAAAQQLALPFERLNEQMLQQAVDAGWGDQDNAAVFEILRGVKGDGR